MRRLFLLTTVCSLMAFSSFMPFGADHAYAGKKEDILFLQQKVQSLESQLSTLTQRTGQTNADATVKIAQLEQENQNLTGQVETLSFEMKQMKNRLDQVTRVLAGESFSGLDSSSQLTSANSLTGSSTVAGAGSYPDAGLNAGPNSDPNFGPNGINGVAPLNPVDPALGGTQNGPVPLGAPLGASPSTSAGTTPGTSGDAVLQAGGVALPAGEAQAYNYASNFLLTGDYIKAREAFELYVQTYPNSPQTPDARFRLGEIYLATGSNSDAAQSFIGHIRDYPRDPKAAEAYLKLGMSFSRLEQTDQACAIFNQVRTKFPNASNIVLSRTDLEKQRIGCR